VHILALASIVIGSAFALRFLLFMSFVMGAAIGMAGYGLLFAVVYLIDEHLSFASLSEKTPGSSSSSRDNRD
jgi:hypothetical protein